MWIWVIVHYSWLQNTQCWGQCELKQNIHRLILHTSNYQLTRGTLPSNNYQICTAAVMTHVICHTQHEVTTFVHIYKHVSSTYLCSYITAMSAWINRRYAGRVKVAFHLVTILQCSVSGNQMLSCRTDFTVSDLLMVCVFSCILEWWNPDQADQTINIVSQWSVSAGGGVYENIQVWWS